jgi:hypothetical protein
MIVEKPYLHPFLCFFSENLEELLCGLVVADEIKHHIDRLLSLGKSFKHPRKKGFSMGVEDDLVPLPWRKTLSGLDHPARKKMQGVFGDVARSFLRRGRIRWIRVDCLHRKTKVAGIARGSHPLFHPGFPKKKVQKGTQEGEKEKGEAPGKDRLGFLALSHKVKGHSHRQEDPGKLYKQRKVEQ